MDPTNELDEQNGTVRAPGTVALEDLHRASNQLILYPTPSWDPNDPLNWSKWRKAFKYVVVSEGWRWMRWWCVIFFGRHPPTTQHEGIQTPIQDVKGGDVDFALVTRSDASIKHHFYQPIILLFTLPTVAYTALTVGRTLSWFAILTSVQATYMIGPLYNFDAVGIDLMNVPPMIGAFFAFSVGGFLNDKSIIWLAKRNGGLYEPEMRLWLALPPALITPAGLLMFGLGLAYSVHCAILAVGFGLFGFGFVVVSEVALSYLIDCYEDIIGDALVGVIFVRNIFSVVVLFALTPWIAGMGILNLHITGLD